MGGAGEGLFFEAALDLALGDGKRLPLAEGARSAF